VFLREGGIARLFSHLLWVPQVHLYEYDLYLMPDINTRAAHRFYSPACVLACTARCIQLSVALRVQWREHAMVLLRGDEHANGR
jgi:hypothetical protein